jgi:hypothetical protein
VYFDDWVMAMYAPLVYSDLPLEEGIKWISKMEEHSSGSFDGKLTYPAYKHIPVTYLVCEGDKVITPDLQRQMVEVARKEEKADIDVMFCSAGHGVNISMPEAVVEVIRKVAGESS